LNIAASAPPETQDAIPEREFRRIVKIAQDQAGLMIPGSKAAMVRSRITKRMRKLSIDDLSAYLDRVEGGDKDEMREMISVLTTNVTSFFREDHHFATLTEEVIPGLLARAQRGEKVRIWSAGCSTGAEPYSIAMTLLEHSDAFLSTDTRILASDIDQHVLATGREGRYAADLLKTLPPQRVSRFFSAEGDFCRVKPELSKMISFRELNLIGQWPMKGMFDVIFCRNVVIYFDEPTQDMIWARFKSLMHPGGWLFVGHSERVPDRSGFLTAGNTTYRKPSGSDAEQSNQRQANVD